jgi:hypothetical protein
MVIGRVVCCTVDYMCDPIIFQLLEIFRHDITSQV